MADFVLSPGVTSIPPPNADALQVHHRWPNSSCFCLLDFHPNYLVTIARTSKSDVQETSLAG